MKTRVPEPFKGVIQAAAKLISCYELWPDEGLKNGFALALAQRFLDIAKDNPDRVINFSINVNNGDYTNPYRKVYEEKVKEFRGSLIRQPSKPKPIVMEIDPCGAYVCFVGGLRVHSNGPEIDVVEAAKNSYLFVPPESAIREIVTIAAEVLKELRPQRKYSAIPKLQTGEVAIATKPIVIKSSVKGIGNLEIIPPGYAMLEGNIFSPEEFGRIKSEEVRGAPQGCSGVGGIPRRATALFPDIHR